MSNEATNFVSNSELDKYLKERKVAKTEKEMKKIMGGIYGYIEENSKLIHAFKYTIPPMINEDGSKTLHPDAMVQLALVYSETEDAYLPVYTNVEEAKNRGNVDMFPELAQFSFEGYYDIVFGENSILQGIVINPYTDNLVLTRAKLEYMMERKRKRIVEKYLILDSDLKISKVDTFPMKSLKEAVNFARKKAEVNALWIFEKQYIDNSDNKEHIAILFVVQDILDGNEKTRLYQELKSVVIMSGISSEVHVEALEEQREDFVRNNGILPLYQKVNI